MKPAASIHELKVTAFVREAITTYIAIKQPHRIESPQNFSLLHEVFPSKVRIVSGEKGWLGI
jgi:hypothetical protein